jgi:hypothetical protein
MAALNPVLTLLLSVAVAGFAPNVSVDHGRSCGSPSITLGPSRGEYRPVYVVMADGQNVVFQKSTDAGRTWLAENQVVCQGGASGVTTDPEGNIYIMCSQDGHIRCMSSTDDGGTWSSGGKIDDNDTAVGAWGAQVAADTAGQLFCAWIDPRTGESHIWSSVSADHGTTWSTNVRVDDTANSGSWRAGVSVQPGTNHYLVAAEGDAVDACLYRSRDAGQTFESGVRLETSSAHAAEPHIVCDRAHVICDYNNDHQNNQLTRARTLYTPPDTWGACKTITDPSYNSYYSGPLAISANGRVHAALLMNYRDGRYDIYYSYSTDHGATWSRHERVNDDTTDDKWSPAVAADSAGHAYLVWEDGRESGPGIWFSTNNWSPNAEHPAQPSGFQPLASVVRGVLLLPRPVPATFSLLSSAGREALELRSGANDVSRLSPGVYFVRDTQARTQHASKVVITR